jgi:putative FmdB family regulatory protein
MPAYDYKCPKCENIEEHIHSIKDSPKIICTDCNETMAKIISFNQSGFVLKGGSDTINWKEKRMRMKKRETIEKRQKERWKEKEMKIKPNIAGVETGSWSDAQKMAKEAGLNHESFTPWVEKEKKKTIL